MIHDDKTVQMSLKMQNSRNVKETKIHFSSTFSYTYENSFTEVTRLASPKAYSSLETQLGQKQKCLYSHQYSYPGTR